MPDVESIAASSQMIVCGYAFSDMADGRVRVLNLNSPDGAMVLSRAGDVLETNMDTIESDIVRGYYLNNREFLEADVA